MKIRTLFTATIALLFLNTSYANAQLFLKNEMRFSTARTLLIKNGWEPMNLAPDDKNREVGTQEKILNKKGVHEVETCSMDAGALCNLFYKKNNTCLRISTRGETLSSMRVIDWADALSCPKEHGAAQ